MRKFFNALAFVAALGAVAYAANEIHYARSIRLDDNVIANFGTDLDLALKFDGTKFTAVPLADDTEIEIGNGTLSCDVQTFGNIATSYTYHDASANDLRFFGPMRFTNGSLSTRYSLRWVAGQRGKPSLNAVIALDENSNAAAHLASNIADPDFEVLGTNMTTALSAFYAEGGILLTTAGAADDQAILAPHLDTSQTAWTGVTWGTDQQTEWEADIETAASVTNAIIWAGLKLTNTHVGATDNDQVFFRFEDDVSSGVWTVWSSIGGTDTTTVTTITVATATRYHLKVTIDSSRIARAYINGVLQVTTTALSDATDFIPYIGVEADGAAAAKSLRVYGQAISRKPGA